MVAMKWENETIRQPVKSNENCIISFIPLKFNLFPFYNGLFRICFLCSLTSLDTFVKMWHEKSPMLVYWSLLMGFVWAMEVSFFLNFYVKVNWFSPKCMRWSMWKMKSMWLWCWEKVKGSVHKGQVKREERKKSICVRESTYKTLQLFVPKNVKY